ncbi:jg5435 [Pararge aegeria aegeria]|uniref:Jg5435 protein n=1 Tax=Pararge aegeria aegeria TaxID=348720 RepID=A0A8S4SDI2_9NEOP|nr:jg5435 [Pararge aegeria aegeria]
MAVIVDGKRKPIAYKQTRTSQGMRDPQWRIKGEVCHPTNDRSKNVACRVVHASLEVLAAIRPLMRRECGEYASESRALTYRSVEGHTKFLVQSHITTPFPPTKWYALDILEKKNGYARDMSCKINLRCTC